MAANDRSASFLRHGPQSIVPLRVGFSDGRRSRVQLPAGTDRVELNIEVGDRLAFHSDFPGQRSELVVAAAGQQQHERNGTGRTHSESFSIEARILCPNSDTVA